MTQGGILPLPAPEMLKEQMKIAAILDVILCDEDWLRVHRYESRWRPDIELGTIDNGAGDHLYVLFTSTGVLIKGFDHESPLSPHAREDGEIWPGMYEGLPNPLLDVLRQNKDELEEENVTFCLWHEHGDTWRSGKLLDTQVLDDETDGGADFLLGYVESTPESYIEWAQDYYTDQGPLSVDTVRRIYDGEVIDEQCIRTLNPQRNVQQTFDELEQMGVIVKRS